jgi:hypothetical protein
MAPAPMSAVASVTISALATKPTPVQGALDSAGAGITGGTSTFPLVVLAKIYRLYWRLPQSQDYYCFSPRTRAIQRHRAYSSAFRYFPTISRPLLFQLADFRLRNHTLFFGLHHQVLPTSRPQ